MTRRARGDGGPPDGARKSREAFMESRQREQDDHAGRLHVFTYGAGLDERERRALVQRARELKGRQE